MKTCAVLTALALTAGAAHADTLQVSVVGEFRDELMTGIQNRNNVAAARFVARTVRKYVRRDPRKSVAYARLGNAVLRKTVRKELRGEAAIVVLTSVMPAALNSDGKLGRTFARMLRFMTRKLPNSEKNSTVLDPLINRLLRISESRGGSVAQSQFIRDIVYSSAPYYYYHPCRCSY